MAIFYLVLPREVFFITINTRGVWSASIRTATLWCLITTFQWGNNVFKHFLRWWEIFSQEEYSPEDPANPCVNYPTEQYESYADCDDHFIKRSLPSGFRPFWAVDNISEATNEMSFKLSGSAYNKELTGNHMLKILVKDAMNNHMYFRWLVLRYSGIRLPATLSPYHGHSQEEDDVHDAFRRWQYNDGQFQLW